MQFSIYCYSKRNHTPNRGSFYHNEFNNQMNVLLSIGVWSTLSYCDYAIQHKNESLRGSLEMACIQIIISPLIPVLWSRRKVHRVGRFIYNWLDQLILSISWFRNKILLVKDRRITCCHNLPKDEQLITWNLADWSDIGGDMRGKWSVAYQNQIIPGKERVNE